MFKHDLGDGAHLQIPEQRHAPQFLDFLTANREYLLEWLEWGHMQTLEDTRNFIKRGLTRYLEDGLPWVGIWQDNQMAGGILFFPVDTRANSSEIGYWLGKDAAGRGLMTRAAKAMLGLAFDELGLNRIALRVEVDNERSIGVAKRLGFQYEGTERGSWRRGEHYVDMVVYSMLARDWPALKQQ